MTPHAKRLAAGHATCFVAVPCPRVAAPRGLHGAGVAPLPPRVVVLAAVDDAVARRVAAVSEVPLVHRARDVLHLRPGILHARMPLAALPRLTLTSTLAGVRAVVLQPTGTPPETLPRWHRRVHRWLHATQDEARAWRACGLHLGRQVIVAEDASDAELRATLQAIWTESARMG